MEHIFGVALKMNGGLSVSKKIKNRTVIINQDGEPIYSGSALSDGHIVLVKAEENAKLETDFEIIINKKTVLKWKKK
jgi:hypothetical protein